MMAAKTIVLLSMLLITEIPWQTRRPETLSVAEFNRILDKAQTDKTLLKKIYFVNGYFSYSSGPMLVSDLKLLQTNAVPDSLSLELTGKGIDSISDCYKKYSHALLKLKIEVEDNGISVLGKPVIIRKSSGNK